MFSRLGAWLVQIIVTMIFDKVKGAYDKWQTERRERKADKEAAQKSVEPLKKAQTGKEVDDAADDALGGF